MDRVAGFKVQKSALNGSPLPTSYAIKAVNKKKIIKGKYLEAKSKSPA